jgi:hypothetical protein
VYLRYAESYKSDVIFFDETYLVTQDAFISLLSVMSTIYLVLNLLITANKKEWWGLHQKLKERRKWYAKLHQDILIQPVEQKIKRANLNTLEK